MMSLPTATSTSSTTVIATASLNNRGVYIFQETGDVGAALDLFRQALELTASSMLHVQEDEPQRDGSSSPRAQSRAPVPLQSAAAGSEDGSMPVVVMSPPGSIVSQAQVTNAYIRPINLIPLEGAYAQDPLVNTTVISSILLFNIALVYHVKGVEAAYDHWNQKNLDKARSLYSKALGLLLSHKTGEEVTHPEEPDHSLSPKQDHAPHHPVLDVLIMALYNNRAAASYALGEYDQCQTSVGHLVGFCATVLDGEKRQGLDAETLALLEWHCNLFLYNARSLQSPPSFASAA